MVKMSRRKFTKTGLMAGLALATGGAVASGRETRKVRLGFIGVGGRGTGLLKILLNMDDVLLPAICDVLPDNLRRAQGLVEEAGQSRPEGYSKGEYDYVNLVAREDLDGVLIATPWEWHFPMAIDAMKAGKYAAIEVGPANSVDECWDLVRIHEETEVPCMLLENYTFHRVSMAVLNMIRKGVFGELIHCQCGYEHDLRGRIVKGKGTGIELPEGGDYRSHHNRVRNGDVYPTHGVGPMAHCLNVQRGNRFAYLTSTSSKSRGLHAWTVENLGKDHPAAEIDWAMGDIVTTVIKCYNGETIIINHDVALPRPNHTLGRVQGTKGVWEKGHNLIYLENVSPESNQWESFDPYQTKYEHPLWRKYLKSGVKQGHWGTDVLCLRSFIESVKFRQPTSIDVYDAAAWCGIAPLSEQSIATGSQPVEFPDFSRGKWKSNQPIFGV